MLRGTILGLLLTLTVAGCGTAGEGSRRPIEMQKLETAPWGEPSHVIAEVNGRTITRGDFYARVLRRFGTSRVLSGVLKEELFFQEAKQRGIGVSPEEVEAQVDRVVRSMEEEAGGQDALAEAYRREGIDIADLRRDLEREIYPQLVIGKVTRSMRRIDDAMLRDYYQETYKHTRYVTRHIAFGFLPPPGGAEGDVNRLKLEAYNKASRAADRVRKGNSFETLARAESEDSVTAQGGGNLGAIHEDSPMEPALKNAIFALRPGEVSEPVENPSGGYHIFQVTEIIPGESFADAREKIRTELSEREPELEEIEAAVRGLRDRAQVRILGMPGIEDAGIDDPAGRGPGNPGGAGAVGTGGGAAGPAAKSAQPSPSGAGAPPAPGEGSDRP